jgi:hypothetical protein
MELTDHGYALAIQALESYACRPETTDLETDELLELVRWFKLGRRAKIRGFTVAQLADLRRRMNGDENKVENALMAL